MKSSKEFVIKNDTAEIQLLSEEVVGFCRGNGIKESVCFDVRLALEEVISNTIKYGYDDSEVHTIRVRVEREAQELLLEVEDSARSFNPLAVPKPDVSLPVEEKSLGGLGIFLLQAVMDRLEYNRVGEKNILRLTKLLGQSSD